MGAFDNLTQRLQRRKTMANAYDQNRAAQRSLASLAPASAMAAVPHADVSQTPLQDHMRAKMATAPTQSAISPLLTGAYGAMASVPQGSIPASPLRSGTYGATPPVDYNAPAMPSLHGGQGMYPGMSPEQLRAAHQHDQFLGKQQQSLLRRAVTPTHFPAGTAYGGPVADSPLRRHQQQADSVIAGGAGIPMPNPQFSGMAQRFPQGMVTPHPADPTPLPTNDLDARNGYGIGRGPGAMNLQTQLTPDQAAGMDNGTIGSYGNSDLRRINGRNVLIGRAPQPPVQSPGESVAGSGPYGSMSPLRSATQASVPPEPPPRSLRQMVQDGQQRQTQANREAQIKAAGLQPGDFQGLLAKNRAATQEQQANRRTLQDLRRAGVKPTDKSVLSLQERMRNRPAAAGQAMGGVPTDKAFDGIAKTDSKPWGMYGINDFATATPDQFAAAMRTPEWEKSSPEAKAARIAELQNIVSVPGYQNHAHLPELKALMQGNRRSADQIRSQRTEKQRQDADANDWKYWSHDIWGAGTPRGY